MPFEVSRNRVVGVCKMFINKGALDIIDIPCRVGLPHLDQQISDAFLSAIERMRNVCDLHSGKIEFGGLKNWHAKCKDDGDEQPGHDDVEVRNNVPGGKAEVHCVLFD